MSKSIKIISTFLICTVTLFYTAVVAFASDYKGINDTVYASADYFGLEELPYGENTGVVQFQYDVGKFLTLYFDRLSIYDNHANPADRLHTYAYDHYWSVFWSVSGSTWDYKFNCMSDSPIYYKKTYSSNGVFSSQIGSITTMGVYHYDETIDGTSALNEKLYPVYVLNNYSLSNLVGDWVITSNSANRRVYSNCFQVAEQTIDSKVFYVPARAGGVTPTPTDGLRVGYNVEYYPTCEYLQNASVRSQLVTNFNELMNIEAIMYEQLTEFYLVNSYLDTIQYLVDGIYAYNKIYYAEVVRQLEKLNETLAGPTYDSSQGLGSNTEFGDSVGGLMQDTEVPSIDVSGIESNLGNSFLFIRTMFDKILNDFNLSYVVIFLLGMSFIAYTLGRAISNRMNR